MLSKQEHLLILLMEEAAEIAQAASKVLRFTGVHRHPNNVLSNVENLQVELNDLYAIVDELLDIGLRVDYDEDLIQLKREKIKQYINISQELGCHE